MEERRGLDDPQSKRKKKSFTLPSLAPHVLPAGHSFPFMDLGLLGCLTLQPQGDPILPYPPISLVSGSWLTQLCSGHPTGPGMTAQVWRLGPLTWVSDLMAQLLQLVQLWDREEQGRNQRE